MKKRIKNLLIGSGLAVAATAALSAIYQKTAKALMKLALDREEPKFKEKGRAILAGSDHFSGVMARLMEGAARLEQCGCESVEITSHDGIKLVGHFYPCENPKRVIVAMHGWRSSWSQDFGVISEFWHKNGCAVLYAEQRGQGGSGGEYMGFGLLERHDCRDWINWVNERTKGALPIYLGGVSMGATTILMTAGFELPETVSGIIADCGFTAPHAIWKHVIQNNLHLPYGLYSAAARDLYQKKNQLPSDSYSCIEAMQSCKVPVLFIHGTDDTFVPVEMTYENYKACAAPKRLLIVPGAAHGMSYLVDQAGYEAAVLRFWKDLEQGAESSKTMSS